MITKFYTLELTSKERDMITSASVHAGEFMQLFLGANERSRGDWLTIELWLDQYLQEINRNPAKRMCTGLACRIRNAIDFGEPSRVEESKAEPVPAAEPVARQKTLFEGVTDGR